MELTLINKTKYDTATLRKFITAGIKAYYRYKKEVGRGRGQLPARYEVTVRYQHRDASRCGLGWYLRNKFHIMPNRDYFDVDWMGETIIHEMEHNNNMRHADMHSNYLIAWRLDFQKKFKSEDFNPKPKIKPAPKPKPTEQDKINALMKRKKNWTTKHRRAETALKTINRKIKFYEKRQQKQAQYNTMQDNVK